MPHFVDVYGAHYWSGARDYMLRRYQADLNYIPVQAVGKQLFGHIEPPHGYTVGLVKIVRGNKRGGYHAVVCRDGRIVHDPGGWHKRSWASTFKLLGWVVLRARSWRYELKG